MERYNVTGMSCAACSARVEKAVSALGGVSECSVNLLTGSMTVSGSATSEEIIAAVTAAGYGASKMGVKQSTVEEKPSDGTKRVVMRLISSLILLLPLMYVSMGHTMWGFYLPRSFAENPYALALTQLLLSGAVMIINGRFFTSGFKGLVHRAPNMDTLVALGSAAAFVYSTAELFIMTYESQTAAMHRLHGLYFESAAMILTLITVGKMLEERAKGKTTSALKGLMKLAPKTATVLRDGKERVIPASEVQVGDVFLLRPGDNVPVDGKVLLGSGAVDESALTGESLPIDKVAGDRVFAATSNRSGFLTCEATRVGEDTAFSEIIKLVSEAAATKAPVQKLADKVSGIFVPTVIAIAAVTFILWMIFGASVGYALARAISVLVISCPCALGLATPVAIMVASGVSAKGGILFKTAASLEECGKVKTVALDKTGTITEGKPKVTDIIPSEEISEIELVTLAASLEHGSEHPLARAVTELASERNITLLESDNFVSTAGRGVSASIGEDLVTGGSLVAIGEQIALDEKVREMADSLSSEGKTPLLFTKNEKFIGIIAVADTVKEDSVAAIAELKKLGIRTVMLTGDNTRTARAIADRVGIDDVRAGVMPSDKAEAIRELSSTGRTAMVGDGINDAPALTCADIGIAIGAGTDVAIDSSEVVLVHSRLYDAVTAIKLSRATLRNIRQNLFWAFFYNAIGIPLAAGAFVGLGIELDPMFGAAAMSLSSFCVVSNALRLNLFRSDRPHSTSDITETVLNVEGMMCGHCEMAVKKAVESLKGVVEATADHKKGTVTVRACGEISEKLIVKTIEKEGYRVK